MTERQIQSQGGLWPLTWPMGLTTLRLLLLPVFLWSLLSNSRGGDWRFWWVPLGIFVVMAITDKLDGYLARKLNQTTRVGAVLDPVADKLLVGCSVILLSFDWVAPPGFDLPWWVVVAVYGKDIITVLGILALLALAGRVNIIPRFLGKVSTVVQLALVMAVLMAPGQPVGWLEYWHMGVKGLQWLVLVLAVGACSDYVIQGIGQYRSAAPAGPT